MASIDGISSCAVCNRNCSLSIPEKNLKRVLARGAKAETLSYNVENSTTIWFLLFCSYNDRHAVAFSECACSSGCSLLDIIPGIFVPVPVPLHRPATPKQQGIPRLQPSHFLPFNLLFSGHSDRSRPYTANMGLRRIYFD